ncbi:MAG: hypothetical protein KDA42_07400 [Planctomycetales bacterium]|nr:hypothetical protein [Planctomycetales bacterium]
MIRLSQHFALNAATATRPSRLLASAALLLALAGLLTTGCGGDSAAAGGSGGPQVIVTGNVTVGGKPVDNGRVEFIPKPGFVAPVVAIPIENGAYAIGQDMEALPGPYIVTIRGKARTGRKIPHPDYLNCFVPETETVIALHYSSNAETPLSAELVAGTQTFDFALPALTDEDRKAIEEQERLKEEQEKMQGGG